MLRRRPAPALALVAAIVATVAAAGVPARADERLDAAQRRANQAAADLNRAEVDLARVQGQLARVETRVRTVEERVVQSRDQVRDLALRLYVEGPVPLTRILRMSDANQMVRARQFSSLIAGSSTDSLEQYRGEREDLEIEQRALEASQRAQAAALDDLRRRQAEAVREVDRLARIVQEERERAAREEQARQAQARAGGASSNGAAPAAPAPAAGSGSGGTGPASVAVTGSWVCPVQGPRAFSDDYGASRWGGGTHMGNDILAPRGTPVVANVSGVVTHRNGSISGLAYFLAGDDGNRYFGAHLDSFGASGRVSIGTVIGTVGNTGDASGGPPHLHFEMHPGGSGYTNPYPMLSRYC